MKILSSLIQVGIKNNNLKGQIFSINQNKTIKLFLLKTMSGHSHWKTVKRTKETEDKKRSKIFSKLAREISIAVREKGKNIETNPRLRLILEKARQYNLPKDNIERAIKKGAGEVLGENLENVLFEAYGPGGVAIIIEGITDNKNRALMEIKQVLSQNGGKMVNEGGVQWLFERKIDPKSNTQTKRRVKKRTGFSSTSLTWTAKQNIEVSEKDKETCQKLFDFLYEIEEVSALFSNLRAFTKQGRR